MRLADLTALALWSLRSRAARSALMTLTLASGVAAVCLAAAVTNGYARALERLAFGDYARSLVVSENWASRDRFGPPRLNDATRLEDALGDDLEAVAVWRVAVAAARGERETAEVRVFGVQGDYRYEAGTPLAAGRHLTQVELTGAQRVCVIGDRAALDLYPGVSPGDLIGRTVRLSGVACEIAGVFDAPRTRTAERYAEAVLTPFLAAGRYFQRETGLAPNEATQITLVLTDRRYVHGARAVADRVLRRAHGVPLSGPVPFRYADPAAPARAMARQNRLLSRLLYAIAAITLIASIIGYAASTLSAIDARRRDIALQMASGASSESIAGQILIESLLTGLAGAGLGCAFAAAAAPLSAPLIGAPAIFDLEVALIALVSGAGAGVLAGVVPARRAALQPPAAALRV